MQFVNVKDQAKKPRQWLREASLSRLNLSFRSKSECVLSENLFENNDIDLDQLEESGLTSNEVNCLKLWREGSLSGRHCMIAMLECRKLVIEQPLPAREYLAGGHKIRPEFAMLSSTIDLPEHFLVDSGFLFDQVFSRSSESVTREAIKLLSAKTLQNSTEKLRIDQINLAIKQVKIDHICVTQQGKPSNSENATSSNQDENSRSNGPDNTDCDPFKDASPEVRAFRLSIFVELIRLHIQANCRKSNNAEGFSAPDKLSVNEPTNFLILEDKSKSETISASVPSLDTNSLQYHLEISLQELAECASQQKPEDLEAGNNLLKPYIKQLSTLKASLKSQLQEIDDTRAYLSLGVDRSATDGDIRKAYHSAAIRLHPDKPGGDTAKFQALQTNYQEIMNKRRASGMSDKLSEGLQGNEQVRREAGQATELLNLVANGLDTIKSSADELSRIAQNAIKWVQAVDIELDTLDFPKKIDFLLLMFENGIDGSTLRAMLKKKKAKSRGGKGVISIDSLGVDPVVSHLEQVCDEMQKIASLAMQLPSCGFRFGVATAMHPSFMRCVEQSMSSGLSTMRLTSTIIGAGEQLEQCKRKLSETQKQCKYSQQIHDILADMTTTALRSVSSALSQCADACVDCAVAAADLYRGFSSVVSMAEAEALNEAKREAEKHERESEMCAEDKAFMAEKAKRDREELSKQAEQMFEEEMKQQQKEKEDRDKAQKDDVEQLRVKIKSLQVQLRVQHVQALQALNREARLLQKQLQGHLMEVISSNGLVDSVTKSLGRATSDANSKQMHKSLFSLLADFMDTSCNTFRSEIREFAGDNVIASKLVGKDELSRLIDRHFHWLLVFSSKRLCNADAAASHKEEDGAASPPSSNGDHKSHESTKAHTNETIASSLFDIDGDFEEFEPSSSCGDAETPQATAESSSPESQSGNAEAKTPVSDENSVGIKLALLPDYRSRAVWLASLLDPLSLLGMIESELCSRLFDEISKSTKVEKQYSENNLCCIKAYIDSFCGDICDGIRQCR